MFVFSLQEWRFISFNNLYRFFFFFVSVGKYLLIRFSEVIRETYGKENGKWEMSQRLMNFLSNDFFRFRTIFLSFWWENIIIMSF